MKVVSTVHAPSAVYHSLKCNLTEDEGVEHLVVARLNAVDVFHCQPKRLEHKGSFEIWGRIIALRALPIKGSHRSNILVMTDHPTPELIFLAYSRSAETGHMTFETIRNVSLHDRSARQAEYLNDVYVDHSGVCALVSCYAGKLKIVRIQDGDFDSDFDLPLPELNILSLAILSSARDSLSVAILHRDHREQICLLSRDINLTEMDISSSPSTLLPSTVISAKYLLLSDSLPYLIHVPSSGQDSRYPGGVILLGSKKIQFFQFADDDLQEKLKGKQRRTEGRKKSTDLAEAQKAKQKESERASRKRKPKAVIQWPWSEITAWCTIGHGSNTQKYLLCDAFGRLALLSFFVEEAALLLLPLGEVSPAHTITYLTTQIVYLGSPWGDSQLLRIHTSPTDPTHNHIISISPDIPVIAPSRMNTAFPKDDDEFETGTSNGQVIESTGTYVTVLQTFKNIAPIADAVLADLNGNGQEYIVTCSGGRNTGSLNIIRNGAGFKELAVIAGIHGVTDIWPIRTRFDENFDSYILLSTTHDSHLLQFDGANMVSRIVPASTSIVLNLPTLALSNILRRRKNETGRIIYDGTSSLVVQVTQESLVVLEYNSSTLEYIQTGESWMPERLLGTPDLYVNAQTKIVAASINSSQSLLAITGGIIVLLNLSENDKLNVGCYRHVGDRRSHSNEISAVSCVPQDAGRNFSTLIAVAFWGSNHVEIFSIERTEPRLKLLCKTTSLSHVPRCVLLYNFVRSSDVSDNRTHLLASLGNGTVVSYAFRNGTLSDQKTVHLGGAPVCIKALPYEVDGRLAVFASGSMASIFSYDKNRLRNTPIVFKDIAAASPLSTPYFAECLVMATGSGVVIGKVGQLGKLHIRSIPLGLDIPRRVAYDKVHKVLAVAFSRSEPWRVGQPPISRSFLRLLDCNSFIELSQFNCSPNEEITALEAMTLTYDDQTLPYLCAGTFMYNADEKEPTEGRLLLFDVHEIPSARGQQLSLVASEDVNGCVYALAAVDEMIAAAVNGSVIIYRLEKSDQRPAATFKLKKMMAWRRSYLLRSLASFGKSLVLGDAMSSVTVLNLKERELQIDARDYGPLWPLCVHALNEKNIIGSNADMNIFMFSLQQKSGASAVLISTGNYHAADVTTKFISRVNAPQVSQSPEFGSQQLFFTLSGCIGLITEVDGTLAVQMKALEHELANLVEGKHGRSHTVYRAPKHSRGTNNPASGFLDGDFLEKCLDSPALRRQLESSRELEMTENDLEHIIEVLQSMHS